MPAGNLKVPALVLGGLALVLTWAACTKNTAEGVDFELQNYYRKGNLALGEGDLNQAEREFRTLLEKDSSHVGACNKLAHVLMQKAGHNPQGRNALVGEAISLLEKSITLEPEGHLAWKALARAYGEANRHTEALRAYSRLVELNDGDWQSRLAVAELLEEKNDLTGAEKAYQEGLRRTPQAGRLLLAYGRFLLRRTKDDLAKKFFSAVPPGSVEYYEAQDELGAMAAREGRLAEARRIYQMLVSIHPKDYMAWELLAALDEREKSFGTAEEKYRRSLDVETGHMSAWLGLGRTLLVQGRGAEASNAFRRADELLGSNPEHALELANELLVLDDRLWALSVLERARIVVTDPGLLATIEQKIEEIRRSRSKVVTQKKQVGGGK